MLYADGQELKYINFTIKKDEDSWVTTASAELDKSDYLIAKNASEFAFGDYRFLLSEYGTSEKLGEITYNISLRSKTAVLDKIIIDNKKYVDIDVDDLLADILTGTGISLNFESAVFPVKQYEIQKRSVADIIKEFADLASCIVTQNPAGDTLTIKPKHRFKPSEYDSNVDKIISENEIAQIDTSFRNGDNYNSIIVGAFDEGNNVSSPLLKVVLDKRMNYNRTEFFPGDDVYFRVYSSLSEIWAKSCGNVYWGNNYSDKISENFTLQDENEIELSYPVTSVYTVRVHCPNPPSWTQNGNKIVFSSNVVAEVDVVYYSTYTLCVMEMPYADNLRSVVVVFSDMEMTGGVSNND